MKTWRIVSGVLSLVFFGFVAFQSCAAGVVDEYTHSGGVSGGAGLIVSIVMLVGGIVSISTREGVKEGKGNTFLFLTYGLAAIVGYGNIGYFKDLKIWSIWCISNSLVALFDDIWLYANRKNGNVQYVQQQNPQMNPQINPQMNPQMNPQFNPQQNPQISVNQVQPNDKSGFTEQANNIEMLKKYKELLDIGAITQEEFDKKKQELL